MRVPPERRAELHADALKRIAHSGENDWRRFLLAECVETYAHLDEAQRQQLQALLASEQYQEVRPVRPLMITTYERGRIEGRRETLLLQLEARFGPLAPAVKQRVEALTPEQLEQLLLDFAKAQPLKDLHLEDGASVSTGATRWLASVYFPAAGMDYRRGQGASARRMAFPGRPAAPDGLGRPSYDRAIAPWPRRHALAGGSRARNSSAWKTLNLSRPISVRS